MMRAVLLAGATLALFGAAPAIAGPSGQARNAAFAKLPDWTGFWLSENDETTIGGLSQARLEARATGNSTRVPLMTLFGFEAPWNEEGRRRQADRLKAGGRKAEGWGFPMMMNGAAPIQFLITPEEVLIINAYRDVRHIYTDGRKHPDPDDIWPTVWGDSVGHWEGDTLVVDTIQVKNPNIFFHGGPTLSDDAHYVERIRRVSPTRIEDEFTITDPTTLSQTWVVKVAFQPAKGFDRMVSIDFDNDRTGMDANGQNTIEVPADEK